MKKDEYTEVARYPVTPSRHVKDGAMLAVTESGKPVLVAAHGYGEFAKNHKGWSEKDHIEAAYAHRRLRDEGNREKRQYHTNMMEAHHYAALATQHAAGSKEHVGARRLADHHASEAYVGYPYDTDKD